MLKYKKMTISILAVIFLLVLDRFFKILSVKGFFTSPVRIIDDIFSLNFLSNVNISFSLPFHGTGLLVFIVLLIFFLILLMVRYWKQGQVELSIFIMAVIIGAISNLYDRVVWGYVVDYLDLRYFTVFNIADIMIVGGVLGLLLRMNNESRITNHKS